MIVDSGLDAHTGLVACGRVQLLYFVRGGIETCYREVARLKGKEHTLKLQIVDQRLLLGLRDLHHLFCWTFCWRSRWTARLDSDHSWRRWKLKYVRARFRGPGFLRSQRCHSYGSNDVISVCWRCGLTLAWDVNNPMVALRRSTRSILAVCTQHRLV